jgi:hypothetical protein
MKGRELNEKDLPPELKRFAGPEGKREIAERQRIRRKLLEEAEYHFAEAKRLRDSLRR